eukprot:m.121209 g.121209  ORF g.121209 m.121209 type:complete len:367 (+) comp12920_c5_seq9:152-1252(+)
MGDEDRLDMLQAAVVAVNDTGADLLDLVNENEELLDYCREVCGRLIAAKKFVSASNEDTEPSEELVEFIKFLKYIKEHNDVSEFEHEMLTSDVSVYTARRCLEHVLSGNYRSPILEPFAPTNKDSSSSIVFKTSRKKNLPNVQSSEKLVKDMVMIMHARQCEMEDCGHKYCKNMKEFLTQTDALSWEEAESGSGDHLYLKQLEKHFQECQKPSCFYCGTVKSALETQKGLRVRITDSTDSLASQGSQSSSSKMKGRSSRSVSMPPRPDPFTLQQTQQMMYSNPYLSPWAPQYPMGFYQPMQPPVYAQQFGMPVMQANLLAPPQQQMQMAQGEESKSPALNRVRKSRMKAYSTPIKPNIDMDDDEDD